MFPAAARRWRMQTVQAALDIPVPYYIRLNFSAFEQLIDLIGGIDLNVAEPIDDPDYPDAGFGYDPFHIDAGWQHLDGRTALKYARTRATAGSDLDRVQAAAASDPGRARQTLKEQSTAATVDAARLAVDTVRRIDPDQSHARPDRRS